MFLCNSLSLLPIAPNALEASPASPHQKQSDGARGEYDMESMGGVKRQCGGAIQVPNGAVLIICVLMKEIAGKDGAPDCRVTPTSLPRQNENCTGLAQIVGQL